MSNLSPNPITQNDIEEYLNSYSDFSFELKVLNQLLDLKLQCQHGGTYEDPITGKSREFDIRALLQDGFIRVHLSIECKNLQENYPLVVHCLERKANEAYNYVIETYDSESRREDDWHVIANLEHATSIKTSTHTLYAQGEYVAKSADQVGRKTNGTLVATDGGVFDKISQAINSSKDLISAAYDLDTSNEDYFTLIAPVLVVPDNTLWQVKYLDDGARLGSAVQVEHISYFIGKEWTVGGGLYSLEYWLSHLEILTFSQLTDFINNYLRRYVSLCHSVIDAGNSLD
jgi:hypothetical protein